MVLGDWYWEVRSTGDLRRGASSAAESGGKPPQSKGFAGWFSHAEMS